MKKNLEFAVIASGLCFFVVMVMAAFVGLVRS